MSGNLYRLPIMIVALVIGIIMVTAVILPLASEYSEAKTFSNTGYYDVSYIETDEVTLEWDHTDPYIFTVNSEEYDLSSLTVSVSVICGDDWLIRFRPDTKTVALWASDAVIEAGVSAETDFSFTASSGSATATSTAISNNTKTVTYTGLYCIADDGDFVMKTSDSACYLKGDSPIYALGLTNLSGGIATILKFTGTIDDGLTENAYRSASATFADTQMEYTSVNGYEDLYSLTKITSKVTNNNGTTDVTYSYFIVPAEVTADTDNPAAYKSLVMVIPLMSFVVLVVAAAAMIYLKKD